MLLAQSVFPCAVVGQKDCAPTAFRYRFAAAARCHSSSLYLYRRTGALPIPTQPPSLELSFRGAKRRGNPRLSSRSPGTAVEVETATVATGSGSEAVAESCGGTVLLTDSGTRKNRLREKHEANSRQGAAR